MTSKRHFVLYGLIALIVVAVLVTLALGREDTVSYTEPVATSTPLIATSSVTAPKPATPAPEPFRFEVVTTQAAQAKGLSGRKDIPENYGMLFVFKEKTKTGFWMKDMLAPIDIIWLSDAAIVLKVDETVLPSTYQAGVVFYPPEPVRYVLETRAGEARRLGIVPGTKLNLPLPYGN